MWIHIKKGDRRPPSLKLRRRKKGRGGEQEIQLRETLCLNSVSLRGLKFYKEKDVTFEI